MAAFQDAKGTILIVDNEPNVLFFLTKIFQPRGYITLTAQSAEEGLRYFETCKDKIDLLVMDVDMPGLNGIDAIAQIREKNSTLPVIAISNLDQRQGECESLGVVSFLLKPYSLEDLHDSIESLLRNKYADKRRYELPSNVKLSAKILIVDDEIEVTQIIGESLFEDFPESDFRIRGASSGLEALKIADEFRPDVAIIDIKMPEMSGDELIEKMKSGESYCPRDFVIYTGVTDPHSLNRWQSLGHRVLTKPTNIETLHDVLKRICLRHHLLKKKESEDS